MDPRGQLPAARSARVCGTGRGGRFRRRATSNSRFPPAGRCRRWLSIAASRSTTTASGPPATASAAVSRAARTQLFQGLWTDPLTGAAYARARWYDARNASWLSEDPLLEVDSPNLYAFVGWGPNFKTDPRGTAEVELLHATTPGNAAKIMDSELVGGLKFLGESNSKPGGGASWQGTNNTLMRFQVNPDAVPNEMVGEISNGQRNAWYKQARAELTAEGVKPGELEGRAWARANKFQNDYMLASDKIMFKIQPAGPNGSTPGKWYVFKDKAWEMANPRLMSIEGPGANLALTSSKTFSGRMMRTSVGELNNLSNYHFEQFMKGRGGSAVRVGGKALIIVGVAFSVYEIATAENHWKEGASRSAAGPARWRRAPPAAKAAR